jgi:hypothetical protein
MITATPGTAWAELRAEIAIRRESAHQYACDATSEGLDTEDRAWGRVEAYDDVLRYIDLTAEREASYRLAELRDELHAMGVTAESPGKLSDEDEQIAREERWT